MVKYTQTLKVGSGFAEDTFLGPVQNMQFDWVKSLFADSKANKYSIATGDEENYGPGYCARPTIIGRPVDSRRVVVKETFGQLYSYPEGK